MARTPFYYLAAATTIFVAGACASTQSTGADDASSGDAVRAEQGRFTPHRAFPARRSRRAGERQPRRRHVGARPSSPPRRGTIDAATAAGADPRPGGGADGHTTRAAPEPPARPRRGRAADRACRTTERQRRGERRQRR
jgi:hypothetical protein